MIDAWQANTFRLQSCSKHNMKWFKLKIIAIYIYIYIMYIYIYIYNIYICVCVCVCVFPFISQKIIKRSVQY